MRSSSAGSPAAAAKIASCWDRPWEMNVAAMCTCSARSSVTCPSRNRARAGRVSPPGVVVARHQASTSAAVVATQRGRRATITGAFAATTGYRRFDA